MRKRPRARNNGETCPKCGGIVAPTKLLYPVAEKNYHLDGFISAEWKTLHQHLKNAFMISVFGYGAPKSDISAIELMKSAWGHVDQRAMEQTEIIDIRCESDLCETWEPFIHSHHYEIHPSFYESWIANHPRRTGEAYLNQYIESKYINNNSVPKELAFPELWAWFDPLLDIEKRHERV